MDLTPCVKECSVVLTRHSSGKSLSTCDSNNNESIKSANKSSLSPWSQYAVKLTDSNNNDCESNCKADLRDVKGKNSDKPHNVKPKRSRKQLNIDGSVAGKPKTKSSCHGRVGPRLPKNIKAPITSLKSDSDCSYLDCNHEMSSSSGQGKKTVKRKLYSCFNGDHLPSATKKKKPAERRIMTQDCMYIKPPKQLSQKEKIKWLHENRTVGIWVECVKCKKWRYLHEVYDPSTVTYNWQCHMNKDVRYNRCDMMECPYFSDIDLISTEYTAGSLVWAKVQGYPYWPAMVDDDPEFATFYWFSTNGSPELFNVTFIDSREVSRRWVHKSLLRRFTKCHPTEESKKVNQSFRLRLKSSLIEANSALELDVPDRLRKYSFINRYKGPIFSYKHNIEDFVKEHGFPKFIDPSQSTQGGDSSSCEDEASEQEILATPLARSELPSDGNLSQKYHTSSSKSILRTQNSQPTSQGPSQKSVTFNETVSYSQTASDCLTKEPINTLKRKSPVQPISKSSTDLLAGKINSHESPLKESSYNANVKNISDNKNKEPMRKLSVLENEQGNSSAGILAGKLNNQQSTMQNTSSNNNKCGVKNITKKSLLSESKICQYSADLSTDKLNNRDSPVKTSSNNKKCDSENAADETNVKLVKIPLLPEKKQRKSLTVLLPEKSNEQDLSVKKSYDKKCSSHVTNKSRNVSAKVIKKFPVPKQKQENPSTDLITGKSNKQDLSVEKSCNEKSSIDVVNTTSKVCGKVIRKFPVPKKKQENPLTDLLTEESSKQFSSLKNTLDKKLDSDINGITVKSSDKLNMSEDKQYKKSNHLSGNLNKPKSPVGMSANKLIDSFHQGSHPESLNNNSSCDDSGMLLVNMQADILKSNDKIESPVELLTDLSKSKDQLISDALNRSSKSNLQLDCVKVLSSFNNISPNKSPAQSVNDNMTKSIVHNQTRKSVIVENNLSKLISPGRNKGCCIRNPYFVESPENQVTSSKVSNVMETSKDSSPRNNSVVRPEPIYLRNAYFGYLSNNNSLNESVVSRHSDMLNSSITSYREKDVSLSQNTNIMSQVSSNHCSEYSQPLDL